MRHMQEFNVETSGRGRAPRGLSGVLEGVNRRLREKVVEVVDAQHVQPIIGKQVKRYPIVFAGTCRG